jgi:hypothetical protein
MRLVITPAGYCEYSRRREGGSSTEINAPIQRFEGDNIVVGIGLFTTTFVVSKPPHLDGGQWKMTGRRRGAHARERSRRGAHLALV